MHIGKHDFVSEIFTCAQTNCRQKLCTNDTVGNRFVGERDSPLQIPFLKILSLVAVYISLPTRSSTRIVFLPL